MKVEEENNEQEDRNRKETKKRKGIKLKKQTRKHNKWERSKIKYENKHVKDVNVVAYSEQ